MRATEPRVPLTRRLANTAMVAALAWRERRIPYASPESIARRQRRRLRAMVRHAYETTRFWRETMDAGGVRPGDVRSVEDLERLPLVDGYRVRTQLADFRSSRIPDAGTHELRSSGSTDQGVRKVVPWDHRAQLRKIARTARDRAAMEAIAGPGWARREAYLLPRTAAEPGIRAFWDARLVTRGLRRERTWIHAAQPFEEAARRLVEVRPTVVYSYGSHSEHFLGWALDRGVDLPRPQAWVYGGDMFPSPRRDAIERAVGFPITTTYQCVEAGRIAFECEAREGLHVHVDLCAVRILDEGGSEVPRGEVGEVVVSNLVNRATVLLNTRLGDRAAWLVDPCPCGRTLPRLGELRGRVSEIVRAADGRAWSVLVLRNKLSGPLAFALQVQLVQPSDDRVIWRIVPLESADAESGARALERASRELFGPATRVEVRLVDRLPRTAAGKVAAVVRDDGGT